MRNNCVYKKYLVFCLAMAAFLPGMARADTVASADSILQAIDSICGDVWCEGDFDFHFQKVTLNAEADEMQLFFRMSQDDPVTWGQNERDGFEVQVNKLSYDVSCKIPGFSVLEKIVTPEKLLQHDFYLVLNACIGALEKRFF